MSLFTPKFLQDLSDPQITTVFLTGCGGGFDFVHGLCLIPELKRLNKEIIIGSYSFGDPNEIHAEKVNFNKPITVKKVFASSKCSQSYCPEVAICAYLDQEFPDSSPHSIYAYYARDFTVIDLQALHNFFISTHSINCVILIDGGSDSLMKGNESGLGDPIEDSVSIASVSALQVPLKLLLTIGLGTDRYNCVSDASSLRAISELTELGGFKGSLSLEKGNPCFEFYAKGLEFIYQHQNFRSVLAGSITAATLGYWGDQRLPGNVLGRVERGSLFLWPLMSFIWAFDVNIVEERSLITKWIKNAESLKDCQNQFNRVRGLIEAQGEVLEVEELPLAKDYCFEGVYDRKNRKSERVAKSKCLI